MRTALRDRRGPRSLALIALTVAALGIVAFFAVGLVGGQQHKIAVLSAGKFSGHVTSFRAKPAEMTTRGEGKENNEIKARDKWFFHQRAYPSKLTPAGVLATATRQTLALRRSSTERSSTTISWSRIGPNPIATIGPDAFAASGQYGGALPLAGRVSAIAPAPTNSNVVYLGGAAGGVWRSTDGGINWTPIFPTNSGSFSIGSIAVNPANAADVWVGTGEANGSGDTYYGMGIYHSTNATSASPTWTKVGGTTFNGCFIADMTVGGANINAAVLEFPGVSNPACTSAKRGIWHSGNSGSTWTKITLTGFGTKHCNSGTAFCQAPSDFTQAPGNPSLIYVATYLDGIWRSTNGGATWTQIVSTNGYYREVVSAYSASTLYFWGSAGSSGSDFGSLYRINNANATPTFTLVKAGGPTNTPCTYPGGSYGQCSYDITVAADPTNVNRVFVGGIRAFRFTGSTGVPVGYGAGAGKIHVDQHVTVFDSAHNMWEGSDGGAYRLAAAQLGATTPAFTNKNGSGGTALGITEFNGWFSGHAANGVYLGGTQDNGTVKYTSATGLNWRMDHGGDGGASAFITPSVYFASYYGTDVYRTLNGGTSYSRVFTSGDPAEFYPPLEQAPGNLYTLYRGTNAVYRTTNATATTPTWALISPHFPAPVTAIGVQKATSPAYLYAGVDASSTTFPRLYYTHNATTTHTWSLPVTPPAARYITDIWVNPANAANAILTESGFGVGHVFKTIDGGAHWTNVSGNLPNVPVNAIAVDPANANKVFLGTDTGVFWTTNGTAASPTWVNTSAGLPKTIVMDIKVDGSYLVAATHGRSAWRAVKP